MEVRANKLKCDDSRKEVLVAGYFTVEAALVMPVVFMCYLVVIVLMMYVYERCVLEQNAGVLPVWHGYVEEYIKLYEKDQGWKNEQAKQVEEEDIVEIVLNQLGQYENEKYLLGKDVCTNMEAGGDKIRVDRSFYYSQFGIWTHTVQIDFYDLEPMKWIRLANRLGKNQNTEEENE